MVTLDGRCRAKLNDSVAVMVLSTDANGLACPIVLERKPGSSMLNGCFVISAGLPIEHVGIGARHVPAFKAQMLMSGDLCDVIAFVSLKEKLYVVFPELATDLVPGEPILT